MARAVTAERRRYIGGGRTLSSLSAISTLVWQPVFSFCKIADWICVRGLGRKVRERGRERVGWTEGDEGGERIGLGIEEKRFLR